MSLSHLLAGVWFILVGISWAGWVTIDAKFLGIFAFVLGIVYLVEQFHPITINRSNAS